MWGVSNVAPDGGIPDTVRYAFWFGGAALFLAVLWTVISTKEYSPEEMARVRAATRRSTGRRTTIRALAARGFGGEPGLDRGRRPGRARASSSSALEKEVYLLGGLLIAYGLASIIAILLARAAAATTNMLGAYRRRFLRHAARS